MNKICTSFNSIICLQIKYNLQTFIPKLKWSILDTYFDNLEIQSAEDNVCNFERDYKIFYDDFSETKLQRIIDHIRKKANDPNLKFEKSAKGKILVPKSYWDDPYYEIDRVVHQDDFSKIPDSVTMPDPWLIVKSGDVLEIENRNIQQGHVILESADYVLNFTQTYLSKLNLSFFQS